MIRVFAVITAKPGKRDEVLAAARAVTPAVRAEQGCGEYQLVVDEADFGPAQAKLGPEVFAVIETWSDADALRAHGAAPHMKEFRRQTKDLIVSSAIHVLTPA
jgi:quinol monooxygenase YgiN